MLHLRRKYRKANLSHLLLIANIHHFFIRYSATNGSTQLALEEEII